MAKKKTAVADYAADALIAELDQETPAPVVEDVIKVAAKAEPKVVIKKDNMADRTRREIEAGRAALARRRTQG